MALFVVLDEKREGYCKCGCGQKTDMSDRTRTKAGIFKGKPLKFIRGHQCRGKLSWLHNDGKSNHSEGYQLISNPDHPRAFKNKGFVFEHIVIAEQAMGEPLPDGACVHHINGNRKDNRPENLVVCQDRAFHMLLHQRERALAECGHATWMKCSYCGKYDDPKNLYVYRCKKQDKTVKYHRQCQRDYQKKKGDD